MEIKGSVVVITGASSGLGREIALHLGSLGAACILVSRTGGVLEELGASIRRNSGGKPLVVPCDISSEADVERLCETVKSEYGYIDVLINNAGIGTYRPSEHISNEAMRRHFEVNFFGAYYMVKAMLPLLKNGGDGYILNVGSLFSMLSFADVSVYAASKFALRGYTLGLRKEMRQYGIDVGLLMPATINTPFQEKKGGGRKAPAVMTFEPGEVALRVARMIRKRSGDVILPRWAGPVVKIMSFFG